MSRFKLYLILSFLFSIYLISCNEDKPPVNQELAQTKPVVYKSYTLEEKHAADSVAAALHSEGFSKLQSKGKYHKAINNYKEAIAIRKDILADTTSQVDSLFKINLLENIIRSYNNLGASYNDLKENEKATAALDSCLRRLDELEEQHQQIRHGRKAWANQTLGQVQQRNSALSTAVNTYEKSIFYGKLDGDQGHVGDVYTDISALYLDWRIADSAIIYAHKAIHIFDSLPYRAESKANAQINLGLGYTLDNDLEQARLTFTESYNYYKKDSLNNYEKLSKIHDNLCFLAFNQKNYPEALKEINIAIQIDENSPNNKKTLSHLGQTYGFKGNIYRVLEEYDSAEFYFEKALRHFFKSNDIALSNNQALSDSLLYQQSKEVMNEVGNLGIFNALYRQALALSAKGQKEEAASRYAELINLVNHTRQNFNDNASKVQLASIVKKIYAGAISNSYSLGDYEQAFAYSEGSKVFTLLEGIRHNKAFNERVKDINVQKCQQELREKIARLEKAYKKEKNQYNKIELNDELAKARTEQKKLIQNLKEDEIYRKMVEDIEPLSLRDIQRSVLAKDQTMIEYFVGENQTYIFTIPKKGKIQADTVKLSQDTLAGWADALWNGIYFSNNHSEWKELPEAYQEKYSPDNFKQHFAGQYSKYGFQLYQVLVQPALNHIQTGNRLVIIPDNRLNYTPFDALLQEKPKHRKAYHAYKYLAKDYHISYCYSATLLQEMRSTKTKNGNGKILAFAPSFAGEDNSFKRLNFGALKYAKKEVEELQSIFGENCVPFFGAEATRDNFLSIIEEQAFDHIHLSTHGKANDHDPNYSFISFTQTNPDAVDENQLLYLRDLYTLSLPVKTVVLSACETNQGILKHGEGIMNFTRGLSYAGAQCVLSTLWSVTDKDTKELVVEFYKNLKAGMTKDEALTMAKQSLWENSETLHPYYWAGMIPIGSMELKTKSMPYAYFALGGVLVLTLLLLFRRRNQVA